MSPLLQFLIGGVWAIVVAVGGFWFAGGFDRPKKPPHIAAE
jgi:hypothetical protein